MRGYCVTLAGQFQWPLRRELLMWMGLLENVAKFCDFSHCAGVGSASKKNFDYLFGQKNTVSSCWIWTSRHTCGKLSSWIFSLQFDLPTISRLSDRRESMQIEESIQGQTVIVVVGGLNESMMTCPGKYRLKLRDRKGFIRMAMSKGYEMGIECAWQTCQFQCWSGSVVSFRRERIIQASHRNLPQANEEYAGEEKLFFFLVNIFYPSYPSRELRCIQGVRRTWKLLFEVLQFDKHSGAHHEQNWFLHSILRGEEPLRPSMGRISPHTVCWQFDDSMLHISANCLFFCRNKIATVIGSRIHVEKNENPTEEQVGQLLAQKKKISEYIRIGPSIR